MTKKIKYYKTNLGLFVTTQGTYPRIDAYNFEGASVKRTHKEHWLLLPEIKDPEEVTVSAKRFKPSVITGYRINSGDLISEKLPEFLSVEEIEGSSCNLAPLYNAVYSEPEEFIENIEVTWELLGEVIIDNFKDPVKMSVSVYINGKYPKSGGEVNIPIIKLVETSIFDQMLVPEFLHYQRPCSISSVDTYKIIRKYINDNLDPKWAVVTSNYDFCYTVKKKVALKPWIRKTEILKSSGRSYKAPRFETCEVTHETVDIFKMTHSVAKYRGYTPIEGFTGENLEDLCKNIKQYLDELITFINQPTSGCGCCKGVGVLMEDTFEVNKR